MLEYISNKTMTAFLAITGYVCAIICAIMIFQNELSILERFIWITLWYFISNKSRKLFMEFRNMTGVDRCENVSEEKIEELLK